MLETIGLLLLSFGIGVLAEIIVELVCITLQEIFSSLSKYVGRKVALAKAKKLLAEAAANIPKEKTKNLSELKEMLGKEAVVEAAYDVNGKVSAKDIRILQSDRIDMEASRLFYENDDMVVIDTSL